jgi:hypothetical protein
MPNCRRWALAAVVVVIAALASPAAASAFTGVRQVGSTLRVTSDPGENNLVFIEFDTDLGGITVEDGKGMISTPPCINVASYRAFCGFSEPPGINVNTGDGNDEVFPGFRLLGLGVIVTHPPRTRINGGPGNDLLVGLLGSDRLIGGPGKDRLFGLYGSDTMSGGSGADLLEGGDSILDGTNGRDRLFGGAGADRVRARDSTKDLRIDCGPGVDKFSRDKFDPQPSRCP